MVSNCPSVPVWNVHCGTSRLTLSGVIWVSGLCRWFVGLPPNVSQREPSAVSPSRTSRSVTSGGGAGGGACCASSAAAPADVSHKVHVIRARQNMSASVEATH